MSHPNEITLVRHDGHIVTLPDTVDVRAKAAANGWRALAEVSAAEIAALQAANAAAQPTLEIIAVDESEASTPRGDVAAVTLIAQSPVAVVVTDGGAED